MLFSQFSSMVDLLDDYCRMRGWNFVRLTGSTNRVQRMVNLQAFNAPDSKVFLFLMTTRAGGAGAACRVSTSSASSRAAARARA